MQYLLTATVTFCYFSSAKIPNFINHVNEVDFKIIGIKDLI